MARTSKGKSPLPMAALFVLERAVDEDLLIVQSSSAMNMSYRFMFRPTVDKPRPGRPPNPDIPNQSFESLRSRGFIDHLDKAQIEISLGIKPGQAASAKDPNSEEWKNRSPFSWYEQASEIGGEGRQYLETHRDTLASWRKDEVEREEEYVVLRRGKGRHLPGVGAWCKVLRRTEKRVYIQVLDTGGVAYSDAAVEGSTDRYVAVEDVLPREMNRLSWKKLASATRERDQAVARRHSEFEAKVAVLREEFKGSVEQADTQLSDEFRDLLGTEDDVPIP